MKAKASVFFLFAAFSCIGVDYVDDPLDEVNGNKIKFATPASQTLALRVGESFQVDALYCDTYGFEQEVLLNWVSRHPEIATVQDGVVMALAKGTATIEASYMQTIAGLRVTVVDSNEQVATVTLVMPSSTNLAPGQMLSLNAIIKNINGEILTDKNLEWFSENPSLATVTSAGLLTAISSGTVEVHAKSEGVKSNSLVFTISNITKRTGTFQSAGGYFSNGTVEVEQLNGKLRITLSADFTASIAAGTYLYLANSTNGADVKINGLELGQYTPTGIKIFETTSASLLQYKYVVVLCKPFGVTFGFAQLTP